MELPFTITQMFYCYLAFTLIGNVWLGIWAYGNWKSYARMKQKSTNVNSVHLVPMESYDDLDQDEKDFYGIK